MQLTERERAIAIAALDYFQRDIMDGEELTAHGVPVTIADLETVGNLVNREPASAGNGDCPNCGTEAMLGVTWRPFEGEGNEVWQRASCRSCGHRWAEIYLFDHIDVLQQGEAR